jgi:glutamate-1-semialdehyde 2,1-aminomutase
MGPAYPWAQSPKVKEKVIEVMQNGMSFGAPTALENELAELILKNNKFIEKLRFVSSGTEAVMSAIRLARGYTKRDKILKFEGCYHGHSDHCWLKLALAWLLLAKHHQQVYPKHLQMKPLLSA